MLQKIEGIDVYVVEFNAVPELPIWWSTDEEKPYALCLANAIQTEVITEPGKYAIHVEEDEHGKVYKIARVIEK